MTGIHIDEFYADAARILVSLYGVFPRRVNLFVEDFCGSDEPDEYGIHSTRYQACFATMVWLGEEGYIRYQDTIRQDALDQAVLSGRCFSALISPSSQTRSDQASQSPTSETLPPSVQAEHASIVHQLEQALQQRASVAIREAFIRLLFKMSGSPDAG